MKKWLKKHFPNLDVDLISDNKYFFLMFVGLNAMLIYYYAVKLGKIDVPTVSVQSPPLYVAILFILFIITALTFFLSLTYLLGFVLTVDYSFPFYFKIKVKKIYKNVLFLKPSLRSTVYVGLNTTVIRC